MDAGWRRTRRPKVLTVAWQSSNTMSRRMEAGTAGGRESGPLGLKAMLATRLHRCIHVLLHAGNGFWVAGHLELHGHAAERQEAETEARGRDRDRADRADGADGADRASKQYVSISRASDWPSAGWPRSPLAGRGSHWLARVRLVFVCSGCDLDGQVARD
jgi:hypothetical protein